MVLLNLLILMQALIRDLDLFKEPIYILRRLIKQILRLELLKQHSCKDTLDHRIFRETLHLLCPLFNILLRNLIFLFICSLKMTLDPRLMELPQNFKVSLWRLGRIFWLFGHQLSKIVVFRLVEFAHQSKVGIFCLLLILLGGILPKQVNNLVRLQQVQKLRVFKFVVLH